MSEKTLFIIRGVPGAGKSTLANKITKNVVEADQFMYEDGEYKWSPNKLNYAHLCCRNKVKEYMAEGKNRIAVANTFIKRKDIKPYISMAEEYGYKTKIITCTGNYQNVHNVPQETVDKMRKKFQETLQLDESNDENLEEMAYPTNFSLEQFSQLPSFAARVRYCNERLQKLGVGSSRIAYKVDDEKVLKIAKNNKGITQNAAECDWSRNEYECFAKIFEADTDNYSWVEMEIARRAKPADFKKILGISFKELVDIIYAMYNQYAYKGRQISDFWFNTSKENAEKLLEELVYSEKSEYLYELYNYMSNYQPLMVQDWSRIINWGVVTRNGQEVPVIIDVGVNEDVDALYRR